MLDNIDVAILSKVNALAERHGLRAYDFVATVQCDPAVGRTALQFEVPAQGNALREARYDRMLAAVGADANTGIVQGPPGRIIDLLDEALRLAPRPHPRF